MKTFLQEVAEKVFQRHPKLEDVSVIFPNRRAALYFRKHLSQLFSRPAFAPKILTIEDFLSGLSPLHVPEKVVLIATLFGSYSRVMGRSNDDADAITHLEDFYFWGEMLLRDFDEVDKYLTPAEQLFRDLSHQKELDSSFDFLTDEQKEFLRSFWSGFDENSSGHKRRFLRMWRRLGDIYRQFREDLAVRGWAYEGMLHRSVAESLPAALGQHQGHLVFAGFNALTAAEEKLISYCVDTHAAEIHWDVDAYYVNNASQEAGLFFREYHRTPSLGRTFPADLPAHFQEKISSGREVHLYGAAQPIAQAKLMSQVLADGLKSGMNPEETLVVLADEKMLMPVLHGISGGVEKLNVTMGFPLASTPMFNFLELIIDLQINRRSDHFNHRQVLALMGHPYVVAAGAAPANEKRKEILSHNWVHIPKGYLATDVSLHRTIFREITDDGHSLGVAMVSYLQNVVTEVGKLKTIGDFDKEYALYFLRMFNLLGSVLTEANPVGSPMKEGGSAHTQGLKGFLRLFRQLVRTQKIPFSGEPLKGLQVMGVLETRNLDFKNVFVLSLNEGAFPSKGNNGSYIPHNIRRAYKLPTLAQQDAMYSYLFYRVLQRAENVFLFYNSETDVLGQGEMSRYLQQLLFESGLNIRKHVLHNPIQPHAINPLRVEKSEEVINTLMKLNEGNAHFRGISPSALNTYIECRLQFYFKYVAKIREPKEVEEELDARVLGNFLHQVMERFYKGIAMRKGSKRIEKVDFNSAVDRIDILIDDVFREAYRLEPGKPVEYAGQRLVVREIVRRFASQIIRIDEAYAPFEMEALEHEGLVYSVKIGRAPYEITLGGKIDRVDRKGDLLRIIDYKTGKDELDFDSIDSLFARDGRRNKAAFQTLLYALMYVKSQVNGKGHAAVSSQRIVPGLINRMNVFDESFEFGLRVGRQQVNDVAGLFPQFEERLKGLFEELFDVSQDFDQTTNLDNCGFCPYRRLCYR